MKVAVVAALALWGAVQDLVTSVHVFGGAARGGALDFTLLEAYGLLLIVAAGVFVYTAWRCRAERAWQRKVGLQTKGAAR